MPSSDPERYLEERFGVEPEGELYYRGDYWYAREPGEEFETCGIRAVRDMDIGLKPTTYFLQLLGPRIEKNRVELEKQELEALLKGEMIERQGYEKGYVALFFNGRCLGCGLYKDELVSSRIPKGRAEELLESVM